MANAVRNKNNDDYMTMLRQSVLIATILIIETVMLAQNIMMLFLLIFVMVFIFLCAIVRSVHRTVCNVHNIISME